jgi:predicted MFS family arabinose efflux permease
MFDNMKETKIRRRAWDLSLVFALALVWGYVGLNRTGIGFLLPPIVDELHLEFWQASLLISGTSATHALAAWLGGSVSDRLGRKPVLLIGLYLSTLFSTLFGAGWNFLSLFVTRDLLGLGEGVGFSVGQSVIADETSPAHRGLYQGIFNAGYTVVGLGVGAFVMTHIASQLGWRWAYPIVALVGVAAITAVAILLPKGHRPPSGARLTLATLAGDVSAVLRVPGELAVLAATTLNLCWVGVGAGFAALFLTHVRGYSLEEAGGILAISGVVGFSGAMLVPVVSDFVGRRITVFTCASVGGLAFLMFAVGDLAAPGLILALTLANFCIGGLSPLVGATIPSELVPERRGSTIGFNVFVAAIVGTFLMPFLAGLAADRLGLVVPPVLAALAILLIAPVTLGVPETAPRILSRRPRVASPGVLA